MFDSTKYELLQPACVNNLEDPQTVISNSVLAGNYYGSGGPRQPDEKDDTQGSQCPPQGRAHSQVSLRLARPH